jgi:hypothetical protein
VLPGKTYGIRMRPDGKDVFFVHSQRAPVAADLVNRTKSILADVSIESWEYKDWDWQLLDDPTYGSSGQKVDVMRLASGHPEPLYTEEEGSVDTDRLGELLRLSHLIVCISPVAARADGVIVEADLIRQRRNDIYHSRPTSVVLIDLAKQPDRAFDKIPFDEIVRAPSEREPSPHQMELISLATALLGMRYVFLSNPRPGETTRSWEVKVADAKLKARAVLKRAADALEVGDREGEALGTCVTVLRDQYDKLHALLARGPV